MDKSKPLDKQEFRAHESYDIKLDVLDSLVASGGVTVLTKKENGNAITLSVKDKRLNEGNEVKDLPMEILDINSDEAADILVGGDDTDKDGNVTRSVGQKKLDLIAVALGNQARQRARNMLIDAFGVEDESVKIDKLVEFYVRKLGIPREKAERMVAANLAERDTQEVTA